MKHLGKNIELSNRTLRLGHLLSWAFLTAGLTPSLATWAVAEKRVPANVSAWRAATAASDETIHIATFDSGFGGYFTAKSIEEESRRLSGQYRSRFTVTHYGDTANAPYGEKTPEQIAQFAATGIAKAFADGAEKVFIACNTASTQYDRIAEILEGMKPGMSKNTVSIIGSSVAELKKQIDVRLRTQSVVRVGILATPATVKNAAYPRAIAKAYGMELPTPELKIFEQDRWYKSKGDVIQSVNYSVPLKLKNGKTIEIYQMGPGNWVDMIEHAAPADIQSAAVKSDLNTLSAEWKMQKGADFAFDVVGEFCTHYPVFDARIRESALNSALAKSSTTYIQQGPLMAGIFKQMMQRKLAQKPRKRPLGPDETKIITSFSRPMIFISGNNVDETRNLAQSIFAQDPVPVVQTRTFAGEKAAPVQHAR